MIGYSDILEYIQETGNIPKTEGETDLPDIGRTLSSRQWADRKLFRQILEHFHLLPITSDSHIGGIYSFGLTVSQTIREYSISICCIVAP